MTDEKTIKSIADRLLRDVDIDPREFSEVLADELLDRIDSDLAAMEEIAGSDTTATDQLLNHSEFCGQNTEAVTDARQARELANVQKRLGEWFRNANPRSRAKKLRVFRKRALQVWEQTKPVNALSLYWNIEKLYADTEEQISKIVCDFGEWVNLEGRRTRGM